MRLNDWQQAIEAYLLGADAAPMTLRYGIDDPAHYAAWQLGELLKAHDQPFIGQHAAVAQIGQQPADGRIAVDVAAEGITTVIVSGVAPRVEFQDQILSRAARLPAESVVDLGWRGARGDGSLAR